MTVSTDHPDYRTLVQREAPLGFARHFALSELLSPRYTVSVERDKLMSPPWPPLPTRCLGEFSRADGRFRWSDDPLAQGLRELGTSHQGFAALAEESWDADLLSPLELGAACSALVTPAAAFLPLVTSSGFWLLYVSEMPLDLGRMSMGAVMATLRESARYCQAAEWAPTLLAHLGFSCEPGEQGITCRRGEESFDLSLAAEGPQVSYGQSLSRLVSTTAPSVPGLLEQGQSLTGDPQRQTLLEAVSADPESFEAQLQLGRVELAENQLEQAELRFLLATLLRPEDRSALSLLADCYAVLDKIPQAIAVQERILAMDPGNAEASESLERLKGAL